MVLTCCRTSDLMRHHFYRLLSVLIVPEIFLKEEELSFP